MFRFKEGTSGRVTVSFYDADGDGAVPTTLEYRINCRENREQIRDWTSLSPAAEVEIPLTSDDNAVYVPTLKMERHVVTVRANYSAVGDPDYLTSEIEYAVQNLRFL